MVQVSVIVPVRNSWDGIFRLLERLRLQSFPAGETEIIIVDDASSSHPSFSFPLNTRILRLPEAAGSYACRNRGINAATGSILAFTDSDCLPARDWISAGQKYLVSQKKRIAGGAIAFSEINKSKATLSELYDRHLFLQQADAISRRHIAFTANLFVEKTLFSELGLFPQFLKSGGDCVFTQRVSRAGVEIGFAQQAVIAHGVRKWPELRAKLIRVGRGKAGSLRNRSGAPFSNEVLLAPQVQSLNPFFLQRALCQTPGRLSIFRFWLLYSFVVYVLALCAVVFVQNVLHNKPTKCIP